MLRVLLSGGRAELFLVPETVRTRELGRPALPDPREGTAAARLPQWKRRSMTHLNHDSDRHLGRMIRSFVRLANRVLKHSARRLEGTIGSTTTTWIPAQPGEPSRTARFFDGTRVLVRRAETPLVVFLRRDGFIRLTVCWERGFNLGRCDRCSGHSAIRGLGEIPPHTRTVIGPTRWHEESSGLDRAGRDFGTPRQSTSEKQWPVVDEERWWECSSRWLGPCASCWEPW